MTTSSLIIAVFTSPEIATSERFNDDILRFPGFSSRVCLLALDELHLVSEWRNFRPEYYNLGILRTRLPEGISFLGASATLDPAILATVRDRCGFGNGTHVIKTPLDRPEIYIQVSAFERPANSMLDLQFVLPRHVTKAQDIPKTVIFMDSIASIKTAYRLMRTWMRQLGYPVLSYGWVSPYFSDMADIDKETTGSRFEMPSDQCVRPRILFATDVYGLGIDNQDIERVVQWLVLESMARMFQRLGRALRSGLGQAYFVLLHSVWCIGPRSPSAPSETRTDNPAQCLEVDSRDIKQKDSDRRRNLPYSLWHMMNASPDDCCRRIGLEFFDDEAYKTPMDRGPSPCCSICHPDFQLSTAAYDLDTSLAARDLPKSHWYLLKIKQWREEKAREVFDGLYLQYLPTLIMPDNALEALATCAEAVVDEATMRQRIGVSWADFDTWWPELLTILKRGQAMTLDEGEMFQVWKKHQDIKRKRLPAPIVNTTMAEFQNRRNCWLAGQGILINGGLEILKPSRKRKRLGGDVNQPESGLQTDTTNPISNNQAYNSLHEDPTSQTTPQSKQSTALQRSLNQTTPHPK